MAKLKSSICLGVCMLAAGGCNLLARTGVPLTVSAEPTVAAEVAPTRTTAAIPTPTPESPAALPTRAVDPSSTPAPPTAAPPVGTPIAPLPAGQPVTITFIHMLTASVGWALGGESDPGDHVLRTVDGGLTWRDVSPPEAAPAEGEPAKRAHGFFLDGDAAWVTYWTDAEAGFREYVWRTQDGGRSWQANEVTFDTGGDAYEPYFEFVDSQHGWWLAGFVQLGAGTHYVSPLLWTTDGGATWTEGETLLIGAVTGMDFADARTGWLTNEVRGPYAPPVLPELHLSVDGGRTWEPRELPPPAAAPDLFADFPYCGTFSPQLFTPRSGALLVRCFRDELRNESGLGYLYTTADGGESWASVPYPGGTLEFANEQLGWALGQDIYRTADGGQTWELISEVSWEGQFSFANELAVWAVARAAEEIALVRSVDGGSAWTLLKPIASVP